MYVAREGTVSAAAVGCSDSGNLGSTSSKQRAARWVVNNFPGGRLNLERTILKTYLAVPIEEKDQAKNLGARWDAARRAWFVPDGVDLSPFLEWVPGLPKVSRKVAAVIRSRT